MVGRLVKRGVCVAVPKDSTADEIVAAANEVLGDPAYQKRIAEMSELMGLQRHSPLEDAVWVMEYVARTKGAGTLLSSWHLKINLTLLITYCQKLRLTFTIITHFL